MATSTYTEHPPIYYSVRTLVRFAFWSALTLGSAFGLSTLANHINARDSKPVCDITVNRNFTWTWNSPAVPLTDCLAPEDIVVNIDGTWDWFDPYING